MQIVHRSREHEEVLPKDREELKIQLQEMMELEINETHRCQAIADKIERH